MTEPDNKLSESLIYKLSNKMNYKEILSESSILIQLSYVKIVHYYIIHYFENMNNKNKNIFIQGFKSITHIFLILLLYTKHLELSIHHSQHAIYYFIEYIGQITDKDDNMFFNLTLKDAIVYIYTKTIYDVNQEYKQNNTTNIKEKQILENVQNFIYDYRNIVNLMVNEDSFINMDINIKKDKLNVLRTKIEHFLLIDFKNELCYKKTNSKMKNILLQCENKYNSSNQEDSSIYNSVIESLVTELK